MKLSQDLDWNKHKLHAASNLTPHKFHGLLLLTSRVVWGGGENGLGGGVGKGGGSGWFGDLWLCEWWPCILAVMYDG